MDAGADDRPARARRRRSATGTRAPSGAKMIAASSCSRRRLIRRPGPGGAELAREAPAPRSSPGRVNANTSRPGASARPGRDVVRRRRSRRGRARRASPRTCAARGSRSARRTAAARPGRRRARRAAAKQKRSSATANSAKPPSMSRPVKRARAQRFSRPTGSSRTSPQVQPSHGTPTRRPSVADRADDLVAEDARRRRRPRFRRRSRCRSVRQTPQASTRSRSWPSPGCGTGQRSLRSGRPAPSNTIARITRRSCTLSGRPCVVGRSVDGARHGCRHDPPVIGFASP